MSYDDPHLDKLWDDFFEELATWMSASGRMPNRRSTDPAEYRLANWINRQKVNLRRGTLPQSYEERLFAIIPRPAGSRSWTPPQDEPTVAEKIQEAIRFLEANGHLPRPKSDDPQERSLAAAVREERNRLRGRKPLHAGVSIEQMQALIRGSVHQPAHVWIARFQAFYTTEGRWPQQDWVAPVRNEETRLADWVRRVLLDNYPDKELQAKIRSLPGFMVRSQELFEEHLSAVERTIADTGARPSSVTATGEYRWLFRWSRRDLSKLDQATAKRIRIALAAPYHQKHQSAARAAAAKSA